MSIVSDLTSKLDGYVWNLPACSAAEHEVMSAHLTTCVKFQSARKGTGA